MPYNPYGIFRIYYQDSQSNEVASWHLGSNNNTYYKTEIKEIVILSLLHELSLNLNKLYPTCINTESRDEMTKKLNFTALRAMERFFQSNNILWI